MNKFKDLTPKQVALGVICVVVLIVIGLVVLVSTTQPKEVKVESVHDISEMPVVVEPLVEEIPAVAEAAMEQVQKPEPEPEPVIEQTYSEPVVQEYVEPEPAPAPEPAPQQTYVGNSFQSDGVWQDENYRYTWYSSNVLYHYRTPEWTAGSDGIYRDAEGYVVVASSDLPQGTVVDGTPFGACKVYDSGCASGTLDVYTNF